MSRLTLGLILIVFGSTPGLAEAPRGARAEAAIGWDFYRYGDSTNFNTPVVSLGLGYDFPIWRSLAVGADIEAGTKTGELTLEYADGHTVRDRSGLDIYAGGRLSLKVSDPLTLFVRGGYASLQKRVDLSGPAYNQRWRFWRDGFRVSGGLQYRLGRKIYAGAEYRYSELEDFQARHQVIALVGYRF